MTITQTTDKMIEKFNDRKRFLNLPNKTIRETIRESDVRIKLLKSAMQSRLTSQEEELEFLDNRLKNRQIIFQEWAFADKRLINDIREFGKDTIEIEKRVQELKSSIEKLKEGLK